MAKLHPYSEEDRVREGKQWSRRVWTSTRSCERSVRQCPRSGARSFAGKNEYLESYGYSAERAMCKAVVRGAARQGHSDAYRRKVDGLLRDRESIRGVWERIDQHSATTIEAQDDESMSKTARVDGRGGRRIDRWSEVDLGLENGCCFARHGGEAKIPRGLGRRMRR